MTDPYQVLGVSQTASDDEVKKAYRTLCKRYHPDANVGKPDAAQAEKKFMEVQQAYEEIMHRRQGGGQRAGSGYNGGYGYQVLVNHGFGYKTRYAHLSKVLVQPGERVARGQVIAETGNTGISSGPHLHYEVIHKGVPVNPINYFNRNMTPEEYERLMENMRETNFEKL